MKLTKIMLVFALWLLLLTHAVNNNKLPSHYLGHPITVTAEVTSMPKIHAHSMSFNVNSNIGRLKLSWFGKPTEMQLGERWRLTVKLKPPHGYHNPGGFNYERWLLSQHIVSVGYVYNKGMNKKLSATHSIRALLAKSLSTKLENNACNDIVLALTLGFNNLLTQSHRDIFQQTGTSHLMAISGLHVGMIAGVVFTLVAFLTRFFPNLLRTIPKQKIAAVFSIAAAMGYSGLAGFSVSTKRAMIMISFSMLAYFFTSRQSVAKSFATAFLVVVFLDPLTIFAAGFWLSFGAVFFLLFALGGRIGKESGFWQWGRAQMVCSVALIPLTAWYFHGFSMLGIIANLVAIPVVSFIVVPASLLGIITLKLSVLSDVFFNIATITLHYLMLYLSDLTFGQVYFSLHNKLQFICALMVVIIIFLPKGLRVKHLIAFFLLPIVFAQKVNLPQGQFEVTVLDVGQGLSCVIRTAEHNIIFDTGPRFDEFDAGKNIVIPYLKFQGIKKIDTIVISHGDNDHVGGLASIMTVFPPHKLYTSVPDEMHHPATMCDKNIHWAWDGVQFAFLNNAENHFKKDNNNSCVLKVTGKLGSVLFTGDIEKQAERVLLSEDLNSTAIVVPHHGSRTSSTQKFVERVKPKYALFSYGFLNRFHHPNQKVVERYRKIGAKILSTVEQGAITHVF